MEPQHLVSRSSFLTCETDFVLCLAVVEDSVLPMGEDSSHATLKVTSERCISEVTSHLHFHEKHRMAFGKVVMRCKMSKSKEMTNDK